MRERRGGNSGASEMPGTILWLILCYAYAACDVSVFRRFFAPPPWKTMLPTFKRFKMDFSGVERAGEQERESGMRI